MMKFLVISLLMHLVILANLVSEVKFNQELKLVEIKVELVETRIPTFITKTNDSTKSVVPKSKQSKSMLVTNDSSSIVEKADTEDSKKQYISDYAYFDSSPSLLESPKIKYPERMKFLEKEGSVKIRVLITKEGVISDYEVVYFTNDDFKEEAVKSIKNMRFNPLKKDGTVISAWIDWDIEFKL